MDLLNRTRSGFERLFGAPAQATFQAPGRVNLIGEHTDYNDGFVLPAAIDYHTVIAGRTRPDRTVRLCALDLDEAWSEFDLDAPISRDLDAPWSDYIRGVCQVLLSEGYRLSGADLVIAGNVPQGAGLSSSASLEIVTAKAMTGLSGEPLDGTRAAIIGQKAENDFVGCQCGIMDQLISARGQQGHAALIDCRSLATRPVAMPADAAIVIVNSNVKRGLVGSEYNTRRLQCEEAAHIMDVQALRDADMERLEHYRGDMDDVTYRRARHVITENARTLAAADALESGDWSRIQRLMAESHASMREDFEITVPPIDGLVAMISETLGSQGGVRMTGGGFGGCVVALVPESRVEGVVGIVRARYAVEYGIEPSVHICHPVDGAFPGA
ncbi:galactokinase [Saccharospirillum salsuginis]|uniref:Galactokinase n=1 Tax=Saccharospirillum salsuginis TaxID=418750 RepID=A0A918KDT7_9GAMM|nr:galactokinase [Saccharospirillum salsuginis]GGX59570.1 galactokinase [Saccharospirillum salsuginis]